ncbi:zinc finger FYVE domain-containing protein 9 isoform X2 [Odontomachus brunneus]|uniref:zinc finger FYVE domain-containing protein 9 isoform X2 n=1 Tax=Odontomachus brunneus TaxID=486640 RepID=UPI0013F297B2|nr:zinc finger FYVE domain-containing protein 9 isoform X2 [Odontomachus brunneus]
MEKFAIDLDKVLDDFEFNEDCAEQVAQVATSTIDVSDTDKHATETVHPKTYNYVAANSEKEKAVDSMSSFEKYRDTRSIDIDCRYSLAERNIMSESKDSINNYYTHDHVGDKKTGQKLCVHSHDSDQAHLTLYNDISHNLLQKQQNGSNDSKDDNRYDKKLNQPNIKPSISNVFNSLNEYINAPTGSLDYVEPRLDETDDLPKTSIDNIEEKDLRPSRSVMIECSTSKTKGFVDITGTNTLDYKNVLPVEVDKLVGMETINKQDNSVQNVILHSASMQCEKNSNSNVISETVNTTNSRYECDNVIADTELSSNKIGVNEQFAINVNRFDKVSESVSGKQKQLDTDRQDLIDKCTFGKNKESSVESITTKLDTNIVNKTENENIKATNNTSSIMMTINISDDFSEEELNRYLSELEEEERQKEKAILCADTSSIKLYNESSDGTAKIVSQHQRDNEDIKETPIFEKIMTGELPKVSGEEFQEKEAKKFPAIDYNTGVCNKNTMDVSAGKKDSQELNDTVKVASGEKYDQSRDTQDNELDKTVKDNDITKTAGQHMETRENTSETVLSAVVEENKVPSKPENAGEQSSHSVNMMQKLQQNIDIDTQSQDNSDDAVKNREPESKEIHDDKDCGIIESDKGNVLIMHDNEMHNSGKTFKAEGVANVTDACIASDTDENSQEAEKPTRPQTLDIVSTHNKDDSYTLESSGATPGETEHSETGGPTDEDRGASSDVSDNSLMECSIVLGKQPPFWVPDSDAPCCMLCDVRFTVLKRRHHCRACGKVLCHKCCNMKYRLEYQGNIDSRVCVLCHHALTKAESEQGMGDWSTSYSSYAGCSDINSPQGRQPNPNNPMEYCSTIPPLQQLAGGLPPPPTVMVPVGVLKREGSKHRTEGQKSVMFSDELDTCWDLKPPYRKQGNKRIFASASTSTDVTTRRQSHPPLDNTTNSYIPHDPNLLPRVVTIHKGQITYHPPTDENVLYKTLKNECEPPVMFAINRNLYAYVKITNLNCCVNKVCWNVTSRGLACVGQDEVILLVETLPDETRIPKDLLIYINQLYLEAIKGNTMTELGFSVFQGGNLLGSREHTGFLFIRQTLQCLQKIILPPAPFLVGLLVHRWETPWAKVFPLRLLLRLGAEYRYYPCPLVSVRFRDALYFEIGHTVMKVLADFRNFGYTLPGVKGLTIHLKNRTTDVMFPRNRYDQVIKGLHNSNDHVLAYASNFSISADSHLVCIQTNTGDESNYQTQAINIHNKPRTVTGASFIVINGALKSSMGLSAKSSIVEDGLMVEIMPEKMEALKAALKNMQDFSIGCGRQGASEPDETVNIKWVDNDTLFNLGVKSPIDGQLMDGIPSIRVHNGTDYKGITRFIRWTEVFLIKSDDHSNGVSDPVDVSKLSGSIAKATCVALVKLLDLLATAGLTKLGVRATIHPDNVGYEAGSEGTKLPPIYMNSLDNELIQVLHKAAQNSQDEHTVLELIFYVLDN